MSAHWEHHDAAIDPNNINHFQIGEVKDKTLLRTDEDLMRIIPCWYATKVRPTGPGETFHATSDKAKVTCQECLELVHS